MPADLQVRMLLLLVLLLLVLLVLLLLLLLLLMLLLMLLCLLLLMLLCLLLLVLTSLLLRAPPSTWTRARPSRSSRSRPNAWRRYIRIRAPAVYIRIPAPADARVPGAVRRQGQDLVEVHEAAAVLHGQAFVARHQGLQDHGTQGSLLLLCT